ncbi:MAG: MerR family transcriptional regulator [Proteobacteria bacterium]|nr:MerR family transcriptional regulator [Pseudomonadota bacterium]
MKDKTYMRINELEKRSGVPRSTIHFYLREELLHPPIKTGRTMAYYDESHLERLRDIRKMKRDMRMPITFIKQQLDGRGGRKRSASDSSPEEGEVPQPDPRNRRKREITEVGIKIFSTKGYHRTRVQDITDDLGISTGTFYTYFSNKRELFVEVVNDVIRTIIGEAAQAIKEEKDFLKRLRLRGRTFYDNYTKYSEILTQLRAEMASEEEWPREKVKKIYHQLTKPIIKETRDAMEKGLIRKTDPDLLAYAMTGLIEIMSLRTTLDDAYSYDQIMSFIIDLTEKGLEPR